MLERYGMLKPDRLRGDGRELIHREVVLVNRESRYATNGSNAYALPLLEGRGRSERQAHILLVGDSAQGRSRLDAELSRHGYTIQHVGPAGEVIEACQGADLVLLDPDLPDLEEIEICYRIRQHSVVPLIVISNRDDEMSCVLALQAGADDYVVAPYRVHELIARIWSSLRRTHYQAEPDSTIEVGQLSIDLQGRRTTLDGMQVTLTRKEFDLLCLLASNPGVVVSRETIKKEIWGDTWSLRTIDTHVNSLRRKLLGREWIVTVRGVGFMMTEPSPGVVADLDMPSAPECSV